MIEFSIGRIVVGMARQGYDLQLTRYGEEGWRATLYPAGRGHSVTSAVGSAWEREPWRVVRLRRQVARARPALMVIALCTSFFGLVLIHVTAGLMLVVGVVVTVWFAFRIAKGMRSGRRWAAVIAAVWWFGWLAFVLLQVPKVMETEINRNSVLGGIGFLASLYFLARGLLAFRSLQRTRDDPAGPLAHHPWEEGLPSLQRRPRFLNKTSLWAYVPRWTPKTGQSWTPENRPVR
jgi:hypothetical protein